MRAIVYGDSLSTFAASLVVSIVGLLTAIDGVCWLINAGEPRTKSPVDK
jgi:hypothetical protein